MANYTTVACPGFFFKQTLSKARDYEKDHKDIFGLLVVLELTVIKSFSFLFFHQRM